MDIEAAKCRKYRMYNAMCGKAKEIIRKIGLENYIKEKYYFKMLTRIEEKYNDARLEIENKKYERRNIQKKNPTKELLKTKRVQVKISEIGEIECINIYYPVVDSEIKMISKKDYTIQEINFTKYLIEKSKFIAKNKYIL
ncbi:MAG: hypothetical protein K2L47_03225, partial [Clostridia bacterium]|nr:hypothetical protein [Clostridia bacterium]